MTLAGHTRVSTQALTSAARVIASELFRVPPAKINVGLDDDHGQLAISLNLPLPLRAPVGQPASVWERAVQLRDGLRGRFTTITGSHVSRVDVRVTGLIFDEPARVGRGERRPV